MISNISDQLNVILNNKEYAFLFKKMRTFLSEP